MRPLDDLLKLATQVGHGYLSSEVDPTEALVKHAQQETLTAQEISEVAQRANSMILQGLHKRAALGEIPYGFHPPVIGAAAVSDRARMLGSMRGPVSPFAPPERFVDSLRGRLSAMSAALPLSPPPQSIPEPDCTDNIMGVTSPSTNIAQVRMLQERVTRLLGAASTFAQRAGHLISRLELLVQNEFSVRGTPFKIAMQLTSDLPISRVAVEEMLSNVPLNKKAGAEYEYEVDMSHPIRKSLEEFEICATEHNKISSDLAHNQAMLKLARKMSAELRRK